MVEGRERGYSKRPTSLLLERRNAGAAIGRKVTLTVVQPPPAQRVVVAAEGGQVLRLTGEHIARALADMPLQSGDRAFFHGRTAAVERVIARIERALPSEDGASRPDGARAIPGRPWQRGRKLLGLREAEVLRRPVPLAVGEPHQACGGARDEPAPDQADRDGSQQRD